jgi:hypothetical protein
MDAQKLFMVLESLSATAILSGVMESCTVQRQQCK